MEDVRSLFDLSPAKAENIAMLSQVAHMYYDLGMLQPEIAERLYFSRSKVSRMLKKAEEMGIVEIKVNRYLSRITRYERQLESIFGLKKAIVMTNFDGADDDVIRDDLAKCAAAYVSENIRNDCTIGITCSRTVRRVVHKMHKMYPCNLKVVQTIGSMLDENVANDLISFITHTFGGEAYFLNAPLYVNDLYVKEALLKDPVLDKALGLMKHCNVLLSSLGRFDVSGDMPNWSGYMTARHREEMSYLGAVGSLCARFFDINGNLLDCDWNRKCIAIPWEDMRAADLHVAVVSGLSKIYPILGALRGKLVDVLITDAMTASYVIEEQARIS